MVDDEYRHIREAVNAGCFVGLYGELEAPDKCVHTGLIICYDNNVYLFHSLFNRVCFEIVTSFEGNLYFIKLELYQTDESVLAFLVYCKSLYSRINNNFVKSCFLFDGSYFSKGSAFFLEGSSTGLVLTTCVGFCLKVINGDLYNVTYLAMSDWDQTSLKDLEVERTIRRIRHLIEGLGLDYTTHIDEADIKRIFPLELMTSGLFSDYPIRKHQIDSRVDEVREYLRSMV